MNLVHINNGMTMTSREIAELTGKRHANVIRDIRSMLGSLEQSSNLSSAYKSSTYIASTGQSYPQYELDKDLTLTLLTGYDSSARYKVVKRWQELESILKVEVQTQADRQYARLESPELTGALKAQREAKGKEIAPHIFSNDYNMMNRIVLGFTSANFRKEHGIGKAEGIRDYLSPVQTEAMLKIQRINTSLIEIGMDYKDRKEKLQQYFNDNFKDKMIEEVLRLES